jgi:hypothetical protein
MESPQSPTATGISPEAVAVYRAATDALWRAGNLLWKLHEDQRRVHAQVVAAFDAGADSFVLEIARRWGKSRYLGARAVERVVQTGGRVVYGAPTLKDLTEFIIPHIEAITADAPPGLRWHFNGQRMHFDCENGGHIHLFGCDDKRKANRGRGPGAVEAILDECGFIPIFDYVRRSVLRPQLLHSGGKILYASSPAEEPDHDFTAVAERAEARGNYAKRTVWDNPLLTEAQVRRFIETDAKDEGLTPEEYQRTDSFRREYLAERVVNKLLVVLGDDWENKRSTLIRPVVRPEFYDAMTVLDPGGNDPHAVTFGYWHFGMAKYVQEDELLLRDGENTEDLAARIKGKERELYGTELFDGTLRAAAEDKDGVIAQMVPEWMQDILAKEAQPQPYMRVMDINITMARDLWQLHKLAFLNTAKDDKQAAVNNFRVALRREEYLLHPRCAHTDRHFRQTTWKDVRRKEYARKGGEHGDLLDTGVYSMRNVDRQRNPYPRHWHQPVVANGIQARMQAEQREKAAIAIFGNSPLARRLRARR